MWWRSAVLLGVLAAEALPAAAATAGPTTTVRPGIEHTEWTEPAGPARIHVVELDLSSPEIELRATTEDERGQTPSAFAAAHGAVVAINGDRFSGLDFQPLGLARGDGETWSGSADDDHSGFARFHLGPTGTELVLSPPAEVVESLPDQVAGAVGGRPMLVEGGQALSGFDCAPSTLLCSAAPRTALGVSADGRTGWLVVVDGFQPGSAGLTAAQLAGFFADDLDAEAALLLDGGAASALVVDGAVASQPSDGVEREVANHVAVLHGPKPPGTLVGRVRDRDIVDGPDIPNATVTLDTGATFDYDGSEIFQFQIPPRWACVTASAPGFHTSPPQCRQVTSGDLVWASVVLFPDDGDGGSASPDAGDTNPDDAGPLADGAPEPPRADGGPGATDAGPDTPDAAGGCAAAGGADPGWLWLAGALALARRKMTASSAGGEASGDDHPDRSSL